MVASTTEEDHVGTAFLLVTFAGLSTGVGAAFVCIPGLAKYATPRFLAAGLAFSAGVMVYVSFVEIFQKSFTSFQDAGYKDGVANALCTLCFMGGIGVVLLIDKIVHSILDHMHHDHNHDHGNAKGQTNSNKSKDSAVVLNPCHGVCVSDLADIMKKLEAQGEELGLETGWNDTCDDIEEGSGETVPEQATSSLYTIKGRSENSATPSVVVDTPKRLKKKAQEADDGSAENKRRLVHTSLKTACAIVLHNFPEGIATYVAALADPKVGMVLAIAIAIHNIPEGLCVALPIFYAKESKLQAFGLALASGMAEPFAALLYWLILGGSVSDTLFGVMFGVVSGMMVLISIRELLPTAILYDGESKVVTKYFCAGMVVMALSLVLFAL